jgi:hypothetical protein
LRKLLRTVVVWKLLADSHYPIASPAIVRRKRSMKVTTKVRF